MKFNFSLMHNSIYKGLSRCSVKQLFFFACLAISANITFAQVPSYVPTNGLMGYWPFTGNANDISGNSHNGTVNGATLTADRNGNANSAYNFNNNDISISNPQFAAFGTGSFSCNVWIKTTTTTCGNILRYDNCLTGANWGLRIGPANDVAVGKIQGLECPVSRIGNPVTSSLTYNDNNWHNFTYVRDVTAMKNLLYAEGILIAQTSFTSINNITVSGNPLLFGACGGYEKFIGKIDDIGIWNRALTQQEITALYLSGQAPCNSVSNTISASINQGQSYTLGTQILSTSGSYTEVFSSAAGCDSTVNLNLTVLTGTPATCGAPNIHNPNLNYGSMTDQDGNVYKTIQIGNQEWMAENLKTSHYQNGDLIPVVSNNLTWLNLTTGATCWYNNDSSGFNCPYGKLYNWFAVADQRALCPTGWHVPTNVEYINLVNSVGGQDSAGSLLKATGTQYWNSPNTGATNEKGFSGLPGGFRVYAGNFDLMNIRGGHWSSSQYSNIVTHGDYFDLNSSLLTTSIYGTGKEGGLSVRCLKDIPSPQGSINTIDCGTASITGSIQVGTASNASSTISYTGGNGGTHNGQSITSTGVSGLTATLAAGTFANGNGTLTYQITGAPTSCGVASFAINIGGQSCTLQVNVTGSSSSNTNITACSSYTWNGSTYTTSGTYTYTTTASNGCDSVATLHLIINTPPTANITQPTTTLTCTTTSIALTASGGGTYLWNDNSTSATKTVTAAGTYSVTVTSINGCTATASSVITSNTTAPTASITPASSTTFCTGGSVDLNANTGTGLSYQWKLNGNNINNATSASYTASNAGSYTVVVTNSNGCSATSSATVVTVNNSITPTFTQVQAICSGASFTLPTTSNNNITGQWSPAINNTATTTYTFTPTAGQCASTASMTVTVNTCTVTIPTTKLRNCDCGKLNFTLNAQFACNAVTGATQYQFEFKDVLTGNVYATASSSGVMCAPNMAVPNLLWNTQYNVRARAKVGGVWGEYGASCLIGLMQNPALNGVANSKLESKWCNKSNVSLNATLSCVQISMSSGYEFELTDSATLQVITKVVFTRYLPLASLSPTVLPGHTYKVRVRSRVYKTWGNFSDECKIRISNAVSARFGDFAEEEEIITEETLESTSLENTPLFDLLVYPNPMDEEANILVSSSEKMQVNIRMYDITGKLVYEQSMSSNSSTLINNLALDHGVYLLTATSKSGEQKTLKLMKR
jgi:uncharacterized protein (TIGR02145 family)